MKKGKSLIISITAMLCLFFVVFGMKTTAHAKTGDLYEGNKFNDTIKEFNNEKVDWLTEDKVITKIVFAKTSAVSTKNLASKVVGDGVTAYYNATTKTLYICSDEKIRFNFSCSDMFFNMQAVESIDFGKDIIDTSNMVIAYQMFRDCVSLKKLDLREFRTPKLKDMNTMFHYCCSLEELNLSNFDTSKVTNMHSTFMTLSSIRRLDLGNFDTSNVTSMTQLFTYDSNLESLDLSGFDTSNVDDMYRMFCFCSSLKSINFGEKFNTAKVKDFNEMFNACTDLEYLDLSTFDFSSVDYKDAKGFIVGCSSLECIDAPHVLPADFNYRSEYFWGSLSDLGEVALDNNKDGVPDDNRRFSCFLAANESNRYLFVKQLGKPKKEEKNTPEEDDSDMGDEKQLQVKNKTSASTGSKNSAKLPMKITIDKITYRIGVDGKAEVIKIGATKKARINFIEVDGVAYPVVKIANNACKSNKTIKEVTLGKCIKRIGKNAFKKCKKLKKVNIYANKSLKVQKNAFKNLPKKARIKVKGVKGKTRDKIKKAIKKQTNANVM